MVAMVVGTLVLTGVVTLVLTVHDARRQTLTELVHEAQQLALTVPSEANGSNRADPARSLHNLLVALKRPLRLEGEAVLVVRSNGTLLDPVTPHQRPVLPAGLTVADIYPAALLAQRTVSGTAGSVVYAAVPYRSAIQIGGNQVDVVQVVILTRSPPTGLAGVGLWLVFTAAVIVAVAVVVAYRLGHRFVRPLEAAEAVTRRIAGGDLDARVPEPPGTDDEVASLTRSVNAMAAALARARGAERLFLLSVSHELRTPMTSIRGFAEAITDGVTPDAARAAGVIAAESQRLERLVGDLLDLAKLQARRFSLDLRAVDLGPSVAASAAAFAHAAGDVGVSLLVDAGPVAATADADRVAQVTANLVENALKYARGHIRVAVATSEGQPVLWVDDDGPGIPSADLPRVFERLFTSRSRPGRKVGSGLGLAIVAELVEAMGGSVRAESPLGPYGGTRVVVTFLP